MEAIVTRAPVTRGPFVFFGLRAGDELIVVVAECLGAVGGNDGDLLGLKMVGQLVE